MANLNASYNGFYQSPSVGGPAYPSYDGQTPFQAVGYGGYYLTDGSHFRDRGDTAGLPTGLSSELQTRTTYPPAAPMAGGTISQPTGFVPFAARDSDGTLDLGYHYDPLDYLVMNGVGLSASVTLSGGVVIGVAGTYGLNLLSGGNIASTGSPNQMNRICFYGNVQEATAGAIPAALIEVNGAYNNNLNFRFTDLALAPGSTNQVLVQLQSGGGASGTVSLRDCQLRGGGFSLDPQNTSGSLVVAFNNNLIEYCAVNLTRSASIDFASGAPFTASFYNNLFHGGLLQITYNYSTGCPRWDMHDNLFYDVPLAFATNIPSAVPYMQVSYNGYTSGTTPWSIDTVPFPGLTADFIFDSTGRPYYPTTGTGLKTLVNAGSRTCSDAGLYQYSVTYPGTTKEGDDPSSVMVDIGYHYVALDNNGNPKDSNSDGTPDYLDDSDGDGLPDSWEMANFGNLNQTPWGDPDNDGLSNLKESQLYTNPNNPDTDGDGMADGLETELGKDALTKKPAYIWF